MLCKHCGVSVDFKKRSTVINHMNGKKHQENLHLRYRNSFYLWPKKKHLQKKLQSCLLNWIFLSTKWTKRKEKIIFSKFTSKHFFAYSASNIYDQKMAKIQAALRDQKVWTSFDETTDCTVRYVANCVVGFFGHGK